MKNRRLFFHIFPLFLSIILITLLLLGLVATVVYKQMTVRQTIKVLSARAGIIEKYLYERYPDLHGEGLHETWTELSQISQSRLTLISPDGKVMADSEEDSETMNNHADRPEIREALAGRTGVSVRYSFTLEQDMVYLAVPFIKDSRFIAVIRVSLPLTLLEQSTGQMVRHLLLSGILIALFAAMASYIFSRMISRPLEKIEKGAERFASGDLDTTLRVRGSAEINSLTDALNKMAGQLAARIRLVTSQQNELDAILKSMNEGVIAIDQSEHIININPAAADFFKVDMGMIKGKYVQEVIRNSDLLEFIHRALKQINGHEMEISLPATEPIVLKITSSQLHDVNGKLIGILVITNDITRMKKLEIIRRDFVANVSHELKTPLTSIKGFVETLKENMKQDPSRAKHFLGIIEKQSERLNSIIDDLLELSRIEQNRDTDAVLFEPTLITDILDESVQDIRAVAEAKNISIETNVPGELLLNVNAPLLRQALVNLIDNAIKYSNPGKTVKISASEDKKNILLVVEDQGCGIAREHHDRLFERFYRVDKARSRKMGGTGLGLSIVKHIVLLHKGTVSVKSEPGSGSIFTISLPKSV